MEPERYTYVVSYDIHDNEEEKVRGAFRDNLEKTFHTLQLCESTYAFKETKAVGLVKADVMSAYKKARENNGESINKNDKIWLICSDKQAGKDDINYFDMCCYELIAE